jgi:hypothetical protein
MTWYYALGNERQGPIDDAALDRLIATGVVTPETLVWRAGMADWQPLAQVRPRTAPAPVIPPPPAAITPAPAAGAPDTRPRFGTPTPTSTPAVTPAPGAYGSHGAAGGAGDWNQAGAGAGAAGWSQTGAASPEDAGQIYARVIGEGRSFAVGEVIGQAWQLVMDNIGLAVGAAVVVIVCLVVAGVIPCLGAIIGLVINPVLIGGLQNLLLKMHRREPAEFGDVFAPFSTSFLQLFLFGLVQMVLSVVAMMPGYAVIFFGSLLADRSEGASLLLSLVGVLLILPPAIYLGVSWIFSPLLIIDKRLDFWPAMELSRKVAAKHFLGVFALLLICGLIMMGGALALCVGLFVAAPIAFGAIAIAYDELFGRA